MAVIRDMMPAFQLFQPTTTDEALGLLGEYGARAWVLAGGLDTYDWLKDRIKRPVAVVDLGAVDDLRAIDSSGSGLTIGAMATLREVIRHQEVRDQYRILADAGALLGVPLLDSLVWTRRSGFVSVRELDPDLLSAKARR